MTTSRHRRTPVRRISRPARAAVAAAGLTGLLVAGLLLVPTAPGWSASYDGRLTASDRSDSHQVDVEAGTLHAVLTFEPTIPTRGTRLGASVRLTTPDGRNLAFAFGPSPVVLDETVAAGQYQLVVSTAWPLTRRDLGYRLEVTVADPSEPTPTDTSEPSGSGSPTTSPSPSPTTSPSTSPTGPSASTDPTSTGPGPSPTDEPEPTDPSTSPTTPPPPTGGPVAGTNTAAACGTWVLYQVADVAQLRAVRGRIEDALALPGVVGFSLRFPWDAADLTGDQTTNALLDEAHDITRKAGKALSIRFMAGAHTPTRVFDAGAASIGVGGDLAPLPWDGTSGRVAVFLDAYADYAQRLAAWSRQHGVRLLHLSWFGLDWAELNHGAEVRAAAGYTEAAWLAGHRALIDVGARLASKDLAVELPLSGYGPLSSGESEALADHIVEVAGADNDRFFIQANGWDESRQWGAPDATVERQFDRIWARPLIRGVQMIQPDGYDWTAVFDQAEAASATYGEIYLPSFWQIPGPTEEYDHNTPERIAQLEREIASFAEDTC